MNNKTTNINDNEIIEIQINNIINMNDNIINLVG